MRQIAPISQRKPTVNTAILLIAMPEMNLPGR